MLVVYYGPRFCYRTYKSLQIYDKRFVLKNVGMTWIANKFVFDNNEVKNENKNESVFVVFGFLDESSKSDTQPRQKPIAKFRDSFILDTKNEGLYSTFQENGFSEPNSITLRSIIKNPEDDRSSNDGIEWKPMLKSFKNYNGIFVLF